MKVKRHRRIPEADIPLWWPNVPDNWRSWLPSKGDILFTLLIVGLLVWAQAMGALPNLNSQSEIHYPLPESPG